MNSMDLLNGLNNVRDRYILEAQSFRQGEKKVLRLPKRKLWLIAAIVALTLLLVGCAALYVLRLQDMAFGTEVREKSDGSTETQTLLSLQGIKGTPGYLASKEWHEWLLTYDPDETIYHSEKAFSENFGDDYYAYNLYTRDMKDKLDEICAKYHLDLLGKMYVDPDETAACQALGIHGILCDGVQAESNWGGMRYYSDGSFTVEGHMTLTGAETVWPYDEIVTFSCARKDSFSDLYASVGPEGTYEEWNYTTSDNVDVLIVLEQRNELHQSAFMIADRGDYVFVFSALEYDRDWTKEALEAYAEAFDFTVQPQRVSQEALTEAQERRQTADEEWADNQEKRMRSYSDLGYDARLKSRMEWSTHPSQLGFCLMDLDGDGLEELLVGENGYLIAAYRQHDGGTKYIMPPTVAYLNAICESDSYISDIGVVPVANASFMYLCEDNVLAYVFTSTDGSLAYHFAKVENGQYVWDKSVFYSTDENYKDHPWNMYPKEPGMNQTAITEAEFWKIVRSHPRIPVTLTPIARYPMADVSLSGILGPDEVYTSFDALLAHLLEYGGQAWQYSSVDLDRDGQEELFLTQGAWKGVIAMKNGQVKILECGKNISICRGNYIVQTREYQDGNSATSVYKVENGKTVLVDYLRYDVDKDPENPWFYGIDAQDDSMQPISQAQYQNILEKYVPMELEMRPVAQYSQP